MIAFKIEGDAATTLENLLFPERLESEIASLDEMEGAFIDIASGEDPKVTKEEALGYVWGLRDLRRDFTKILKELNRIGYGYEKKE